MDKTQEFQKFIDDILSDVPEDRRESVRSTLTDETIANKIRDGVRRQQDYSRSMDELKTFRQQTEAQMAEQYKNYKAWEEAYNGSLTQMSSMADELAKYKATHGELQAAGSPGLRKEDVAAILESRIAQERGGLSQWMVDAVDKLTDLKLSHREQFGESLNTRELSEFASKHKIEDLGVAYKAFVEPKAEAKREEAFKAKMAEAVKQAKDEAKREALAERFPAGPNGRAVMKDVPKDAIVHDDVDRVRGAALELETLMASLNR